MTTPALELVNVSKSFGSVLALQDISLTVYPGSVTCVLGDNGAGKSTFVHLQDEQGRLQLYFKADVLGTDLYDGLLKHLDTGDFISAIDGTSIQGLPLNEAVERMRGPADSKVTLTILRQGEKKPLEITLTRAVIRVESVKFERKGDVGYIRITSFSEKTDSGLKRAIAELKKQIGPGIRGYILDLRNDPGGLLDQAIAVSDDFLAGGEVVSTRGRRPEDTQRYNARGGDIADGKPIVVLINGGSASASEILAGALRGLVGFEVQQREIDDTVGQENALGQRPIEFGHFFKAEHVLVELGGFPRIGDTEGEVPNFAFAFLGHGVCSWKSHGESLGDGGLCARPGSVGKRAARLSGPMTHRPARPTREMDRSDIPFMFAS